MSNYTWMIEIFIGLIPVYIHIVIFLYYILKQHRENTIRNKLNRYSKIYDINQIISTSPKSNKTLNSFKIVNKGISVDIRKVNSRDKRYKNYSLETSIKLNLPDFELYKSKVISNLIYTSELLPQQMGNVNIMTSNIDRVSMWFNTGPMVKLLGASLPFNSEESYIVSRNGEIKIKLIYSNNLEVVVQKCQVITTALANIRDILKDEKRRGKIRLYKSSIEFHCQSCGGDMNYGTERCPRCEVNAPTCVICYQQISEESTMLNCCASYIHKSHLGQISSSKCPYCRKYDFERISILQN